MAGLSTAQPVEASLLSTGGICNFCCQSHNKLRGTCPKKVSFRSLVRFPGIIRTENSNSHRLLSNFTFSPKYKDSKKDWRKFCHIIKTKLFCSMTLRSSSAGFNTFLRNST